MKIVNTISSSLAFADYISCFVEYENSHESESYMIPEGIVELVFSYNVKSYQSEIGSLNSIERGSFFIAGLQNKAFNIELIGSGKVFGVRFRKFAFSMFTHLPLIELNNGFLSPNIVFEHYDNAIVGRLHNEFLGLIEFKQEVENLLSKNFQLKNEFLDCNKLDACNSISELKLELNKGDTALRSFFRKNFGGSPKEFLKINRLNKAVCNLAVSNSLTELAYDLGYFDQSHFIHDFKSFTGVTPNSFKKEELMFFKKC